MSVEQAQALVKRVVEDREFAERLQSTPIEQRRAVLQQEGYGDVKLQHISQSLPESAGGELSDDEFAAVAGAGGTWTSFGATAGAGFGSAGLVAGAAAAAT